MGQSTLPITFAAHDVDVVLIAANPKAGSGSREARIARLADQLGRSGFHVEVITDLTALDRRINEEQAAGKLRVVVADGGDGTIAELVNRTQPGTPLTVLPLGTENLLAKYLGLASTIDAVAETIAAGAIVKLDAARTEKRIFLLMAGVGFDAEVVRQLHVARRGNITHWTYIKPILNSIRSYVYPELRLYCRTEGCTAESSDHVIHARWVFLTNLPRYAFRLGFAPQALGTDGLLDLCTFHHGSLWRGLRYLLAVIRGNHHGLKDCQSVRVRRVRIESDSQVPYQLDGDPGGWLPVEIEVLPQYLTLVVPHAWAVANGFRRESSQVRT